jgi:predicted Zn-dependent protease
MEPGNSSPEEMIKSTLRGVLVSRFHYTNILDPMTATATGLTRDGTFLIEEGKIKHPIENLRFTESLVKAFNNITAISRKPKIAEGFLGPKVVPALKIEDFTFSGGKEG